MRDLSVGEFFLRCSRHDFFYDYSDDPGYYRAGLHRKRELTAAMNSNPDYLPIYEAWEAYRWGRRPEPPALEEFLTERAA